MSIFFFSCHKESGLVILNTVNKTSLVPPLNFLLFLTFSLLTSATGSKNTEALPLDGSHDYFLALGDTMRHTDALGQEPDLTHLSSVDSSRYPVSPALNHRNHGVLYTEPL